MENKYFIVGEFVELKTGERYLRLMHSYTSEISARGMVKKEKAALQKNIEKTLQYRKDHPAKADLLAGYLVEDVALFESDKSQILAMCNRKTATLKEFVACPDNGKAYVLKSYPLKGNN